MDQGGNNDLLRLDIQTLKTSIVNYSQAELKFKGDVDTNSTLRSWARDLWRFGSNVLCRSDRNHFTCSLQLIQLLSHYGTGWISLQLSEISGQGSIRRSLSLLESHGLILVDVYRERIKIQGLNLMKEMQKKCQLDELDMRCDQDMIQDLLTLLSPPMCVRTMERSRHIGLTFTLRLVLSHPEIKLTQQFETSFAKWLSWFLQNPSHALNDEEKWVMSAGIELYEDIRSLHYKSLEIRFLSRSITERQNTGIYFVLMNMSRLDLVDLDSEGKSKDDLDLIMRKANTYMTLAQAPLRYVLADPNPQMNVYFRDYPKIVEPHKLPCDYAKVGESLRVLTLSLTSTLTPHISGILDQLTTFFMSGWNCWRDREHTYVGGLGSVCFAGILACWTKQGKMDEILTFVKETKEYLSQGEGLQVYQFQTVTFFPECVMSHALSLGPWSGNHKESLFLELEPYLMGIYNAHVSQGVLFPYLFKCLVQLGKYENVHGIMREQINSCLQNWTTTDTIFNRIEPYVHLPSALSGSVKDMNFALKEALLNEMIGFAQTLDQMTLDLGVYENIQKMGAIDPMQGLINFCFETGMVQELTSFFEELQVSLIKKYGENRIGPITTTILYFGERVVDGIEQVGPSKMTNSDWSEFLEQVKSCVVKYTQLISTQQYGRDKESWVDDKAESICL